MAFLDQIIRPIIDNDLRAQVADFRCAQLVSSCALVQNSPTQPITPAAVPGKPGANNSNIAQIQNAINSSLLADLRSTLGGDFFAGIRFNLVKVTLPAEVQAAVNQAQAQFAKVTEQRYRADRGSPHHHRARRPVQGPQTRIPTTQRHRTLCGERGRTSSEPGGMIAF